jgi:DNA-binding LacI/PurR family transcriptional regulator
MLSRPKRTRVTLSAVAEHAGVALSTASVILSQNSPYFNNFSKETVHKVRKIAAKLGYRTNLFASGLPARGSAIFFAVVLHDLHDPQVANRFRWGFDGDLLGGATETAREVGAYPIVALAKAQQADLDIDSVDRIVGGGVFGAIVRTPSTLLEKRLRECLRDGCPIVVVFPEALSQWKTNAVDVDNRLMGEEAGSLLAANGRRRWLAIMDPEDHGSHPRRLAGLRTAARKLGAKIDVLACENSLSARDAEERIHLRLLKRPRPDGVFALTASTSAAFLHACDLTGMTAGSDVLLVGCDCSIWDFPLLPKITSLEASWRSAGQVAMRQLLEMRDAGTWRCPRMLLEPIVVAGDTCPVRSA